MGRKIPIQWSMAMMEQPMERRIPMGLTIVNIIVFVLTLEKNFQKMRFDQERNNRLEFDPFILYKFWPTFLIMNIKIIKTSYENLGTKNFYSKISDRSNIDGNNKQQTFIFFPLRFLLLPEEEREKNPLLNIIKN
ncbi:hypothetical protein BpHYR1_012006 [Brachionus plicatilis]|uniref:Uncharacterized protein n=1 Tax=Brachionus plicatilis TaxID=10195 RepID=A0A3M7QQ47_BRAPC|nr:hypothetical protein BpHYR1_012006 [Brachionus plicatilis]